MNRHYGQFFQPDSGDGGGSGDSAEGHSQTSATGRESGTLLSGSQDLQSAGSNRSGPAASGEDQKGTGNPDAGTAQPFWRGLYGEDGKIDHSKLDSLPENLASYKETFKKYPTIEGVFGALGNAQTLIGKKGLMPLPDDAPDSVKQEFNQRLREVLKVPATPEGYGFKKPEGLPDELWSEDAVKDAAGIMHQFNVPPHAAKALIEWDAKRTMQTIEQQNVEREKYRKEASQKIQEEFGAELERKVLSARALANKVGFPVNDESLGNNPDVIIGLARIAAMLGEDKIGSDAGAGNGGMTPAQLAKDIIWNKSNQMNEAYHSTSHPLHKQAVDRVTELNRLASAQR